MTGMLNGKVAIVTGGSRGIGRAIAEGLALDGAGVVINYCTNEVAAEDAVRTIRGRGGRAIHIRADVSRPRTAAEIFEFTKQHLGRADILVCNAGIAAVKPLGAITESDYERIYSMNVRSLVFLLQQAATSLNDHGRIVAISSTIAAYPRDGMALYASSKAAVRALTEVAAIELGPRGITANCVLPGLIETDMIAGLPAEYRATVAASSPFGRIGLPDDIAGVVRFLASEESRWITGQSIIANGGARR